MLISKVRALGLAVTTAFGLVTAAKAETTLRIADYLPANHYLVQNGLKPWMDEITAATNGTVKFQHFPAQQLGKAPDILRLTQTDVAQIGMTGISFPGDKMQLSDVAQLPGMFQKSCEGVAAYQKVAASGPVAENDFTKNGVRLLYAMVIPPLQVYTKSKPIKSLEDLKGLRIGTPVRAAEVLLTRLGAAPVLVTSGPAGYEAFTRGTVDGLVWGTEAVFAYDMQNIAKYGTRNAGFGAQVVVLVANDKTWNSFDQATKDAFTKASQTATERVCKYVDEAAEKSAIKLTELGSQLTTLTPEQLKELGNSYAAVADEWAKGLNDRGQPGKAVVDNFRAALPTQ
jgi:TRAP-type C4-dicarboxylate transport system substrate-binding protein